MGVEDIFGFGTLTVEGNKIQFDGTIPKGMKKEPTEVYLISKEDVDLLTKKHEELLMCHKFYLPVHCYEDFPDEVEWEVENSVIRHFLDRHVYSLNTQNSLWIRYATIGQMWDEEDPRIKEKKR